MAGAALWAKKGNNASSSTGDASVALDKLAGRTALFAVAHVPRRKLFYIILGMNSAEHEEEPGNQPQPGATLKETDAAMRLILATKNLSFLNDF